MEDQVMPQDPQQPQRQGVPPELVAALRRVKMNPNAYTAEQLYKINQVAKQYGLDSPTRSTSPVGNAVFGALDSLALGLLPDSMGPDITSGADEAARGAGDMIGGLAGFFIGAGIGKKLIAPKLLQAAKGAKVAESVRLGGMAKIAANEGMMTNAISGFTGGVAAASPFEDPGGALVSGLFAGGVNTVLGGRAVNPFLKKAAASTDEVIAAERYMFGGKLQSAIENGVPRMEKITGDPEFAARIVTLGEERFTAAVTKLGGMSPAQAKQAASAMFKRAQQMGMKNTGFTTASGLQSPEAKGMAPLAVNLASEVSPLTPDVLSKVFGAGKASAFTPGSRGAIGMVDEVFLKSNPQVAEQLASISDDVLLEQIQRATSANADEAAAAIGMLRRVGVRTPSVATAPAAAHGAESAVAKGAVQATTEEVNPLRSIFEKTATGKHQFNSGLLEQNKALQTDIANMSEDALAKAIAKEYGVDPKLTQTTAAQVKKAAEKFLRKDPELEEVAGKLGAETVAATKLGDTPADFSRAGQEAWRALMKKGVHPDRTPVAGSQMEQYLDLLKKAGVDITREERIILDAYLANLGVTMPPSLSQKILKARQFKPSMKRL